MKELTELFVQNKRFLVFPFSVVWKEREFAGSPYPAQLAISVSKKRFRRAVDRNLLKRRIKEAYRQQKQKLYDTLKENELNISFSIIYIDKEIQDYKTIEKKMNKMLTAFCKQIADHKAAQSKD